MMREIVEQDQYLGIDQVIIVEWISYICQKKFINGIFYTMEK